MSDNNTNSIGGALVAIVSIVAIIAIGFYVVRMYQDLPGDNEADINIDIPLNEGGPSS